MATGTYKLAWTFQQGTLPDIITTAHAFFSDPIAGPTLAQQDELLQGALDWWDAQPSPPGALRLQFTTRTILKLITLQRIAPTIGDVRVRAVSLPGSLNVQAMPPNVAMCVSWITAVHARRARGRMYLPPPPFNVIDDDGVMGLVPAANLIASAGALPNIINGVGVTNPWRMTIRSRTYNENNDVTASKMGRRVDTQRRRLPDNEVFLSGPVVL